MKLVFTADVILYDTIFHVIFTIINVKVVEVFFTIIVQNEWKCLDTIIDYIILKIYITTFKPQIVDIQKI